MSSYELVEAEVQESFEDRKLPLLSDTKDKATSLRIIEQQLNDKVLISDFETYLYAYKDEDEALLESFCKYNNYESLDEMDEFAKIKILNSSHILKIRNNFVVNDHIFYAKAKKVAIDELVSQINKENNYAEEEMIIQAESNKIKASSELLKHLGVKKSMSKFTLEDETKNNNNDEAKDEFFKKSFKHINKMITKD